jgi:cytoplasmic iron level regulating protein YaaA (DUF328/UPF0246 family)
MVNLEKSLIRKYNTEIKTICKYYKDKVDKCLKDNFNDEFVCDIEINEFEKCVLDYDIKFKQKFKNMQNVVTYDLPK